MLGTLSISQKVVQNIHRKKEFLAGVPKPDCRGKHTKKVIPTKDKMFAISHITSFPTVESHYCRAKTNRNYLDSTLNQQKMYDLYVEKCTESMRTPVKLSYYKYLFKTEFNLAFHRPKSDRCDICEYIKVVEKQGNITAKEKDDHAAHILEKKMQ